MAESAPDALKWLGSRIAPDLGGVLSGIVGDSAHTRGYHRGRAYVPTTDYSVQLTEDKKGDSYYACAIDMSFSESKMKLYTGRLKAAAERNDPRMKYVREFYGTLNGTDVFGRTHKGSTDITWEWSTSDKSHLWHVHISILRQYSNDRSVMQGILDVLMGKTYVAPSASTGDDEMPYTEDDLRAFPWQYSGAGMPGVPAGKSALWVHGMNYFNSVTILSKLAALGDALSAVDEEVAAKLKAEFDEIDAEHAKQAAAIDAVDENVLEQIKSQPTPEETAALLRTVLGDQADAVFRAGLGTV